MADGLDVATTITNVGPTPARLVAQIFWEGGAYALAPLTLAPGATQSFEPFLLALEGPPDLLGRRLDLGYRGGFFKWLSQDKDAQLLGRTFVRGPGSLDRVGFNCFGCCWEMPTGEVVPSEVNLLPGQSAAFEACVSYSTCSGELGPFSVTPASLTVPAPFTWDGSIVTVSAPAQKVLSFQSTAQEVRVECTTRTRAIYGSGTAKACRVLLKKSHDANSFWSDGAACTAQVGDRRPGASAARASSAVTS